MYRQHLFCHTPTVTSAKPYVYTGSLQFFSSTSFRRWCQFSSVGWASDLMLHGWVWPARVWVRPAALCRMSFPSLLCQFSLCTYLIKPKKYIKNVFLQKQRWLLVHTSVHEHKLGTSTECLWSCYQLVRCSSLWWTTSGDSSIRPVCSRRGPGS